MLLNHSLIFQNNVSKILKVWVLLGSKQGFRNKVAKIANCKVLGCPIVQKETTIY